MYGKAHYVYLLLLPYSSRNADQTADIKLTALTADILDELSVCFFLSICSSICVFQSVCLPFQPLVCLPTILLPVSFGLPVGWSVCIFGSVGRSVSIFGCVCWSACFYGSVSFSICCIGQSVSLTLPVDRPLPCLCLFAG